MKILVATHNEGKLREYMELLADLEIADKKLEWLTLDDAGITFDVAETGKTFEENATLKAVAYSRATGLLTLADDSGLEVDALDGAPGIYSARYGGVRDAAQLAYLLGNMQHVPEGKRSARFQCAIVLCKGGEDVHVARGTIEGKIALEPRGTNGFGYDPVFIVEGEGGKTMAELDPVHKNRISHRAKAVEMARSTLERLILSSNGASG